MRPGFVLRDCDSNRELSLSVVRYVYDVEKCAAGFGVSISMDYDEDNGGILYVDCHGDDIVASCAVLMSIMGAAMIMGARQDSEWSKVMSGIWEVMNGNSERTSMIMAGMAKSQVEMANRIRTDELRKSRNCA